LITDLIQIRRLGEKQRDENFRFRKFLKTHSYNELRLRRIGQAIEEQIDCTACANCCKVASVQLLERDIEKLAKFLRTSVSKFKAEYVTADEFGDTVLRRTAQGCVFLAGNECTVYEARPSNCVNFPHIVRGEGPISTRMWQFVDRASYCPIVYNALEAFKDETRFRR
jgi:Fe-S-cluster containining protein